MPGYDAREAAPVRPRDDGMLLGDDTRQAAPVQPSDGDVMSGFRQRIRQAAPVQWSTARPKLGRARTASFQRAMLA